MSPRCVTLRLFAFSACRLMSYDLGLHYLSEEEVDFDVPPIEFAERQPSPGPLNNAPELLQAFADDGDVIDDDLLRRVVEVPVLALAAPEAENTTGRADGGAAGDVFVADSGELACCHPQEKFFFFLVERFESRTRRKSHQLWRCEERKCGMNNKINPKSMNR